jgi:hypothetical protein
MYSYTFYRNDAVRFGAEKAVLLSNLFYWIYTNQANNKHLYDGYYWTYNSAKAFKKIFPFWSDRKIARMLKELEKNKIIKSGNFNNVSYDRTKWYTIIDKSICQDCQMESPDLSNRFDRIVQPIPDNNHILKPNKPANKETMSETELQRYSQLKQDLEKNGWVGDFDKLIIKA